MGLLRTVARPMLSAIFISGGAQQLLDPEGHAPVAQDVTEPLQDAAEGTAPAAAGASTEQMVQLNGLVQVVGGLLLAFGKLPRIAALLLAGSLVPTTLAGHRFWEETDPQEKQAQQIHFFKNISLLGGLLIATMDREGKPSLTWRGGHAVDHAKIATEHAAEVARLKGELAKEKAARKGQVTVHRAARKAKEATKADRSENLRLRKELAKKSAEAAASVDPSDHLRVRKDLLKKRLTPDLADAKQLVDAVRDDE